MLKFILSITLIVASFSAFTYDPRLAYPRIAGQSYIAATSNCLLARTNVAIGAFADDSDCPGPTIIGSPTIGSWQTTDANNLIQTVNSLPKGTYKATWCVTVGGNTSHRVSLAVSDGATTAPLLGVLEVGSGGGPAVSACVWGIFTGISGNKSFQLYAASSPDDTANVYVTPGATGIGGANFTLEYWGP